MSDKCGVTTVGCTSGSCGSGGCGSGSCGSGGCGSGGCSDPCIDPCIECCGDRVVEISKDEDTGEGEYLVVPGDTRPEFIINTYDNFQTIEDNGDNTYTVCKRDGTDCFTINNRWYKITDNGDHTYTVCANQGDGACFTIDTNYQTITDNGDYTYTVCANQGAGPCFTIDTGYQTIDDNGDGTYTVCDRNGKNCFDIDTNGISGVSQTYPPVIVESGSWGRGDTINLTSYYNGSLASNYYHVIGCSIGSGSNFTTPFSTSGMQVSNELIGSIATPSEITNEVVHCGFSLKDNGDGTIYVKDVFSYKHDNGNPTVTTDLANTITKVFVYPYVNAQPTTVTTRGSKIIGNDVIGDIRKITENITFTKTTK